MDNFDLKKYIAEGKVANQLNEDNGRKFFFAFDSDADADNEYGENLVDITNLSEDDKIKKLKTFFFGRFEDDIDDEALRDQIEENIENGSDELIQVSLDDGEISFNSNDLPNASANFTFFNWYGQ